MRIDKLVLKNFRGIREMELEFDPKLNVLVGINGAGKSSVLDAITGLLARSLNRINQHTGCSGKFAPTDVTDRCTSGEYLIHASIKDRADRFVWGVVCGSDPSPTHPDRELTYDKSGRSSDERLASLVRVQANFPVVLLLSPDRALQFISEGDFPDKPVATLSYEQKYPKKLAYKHALRNYKRFHWLFEWFKDREEIEVRGLRDISHNRLHELRLKGESPEGIDVQLEAVRAVIEKFTGLKSPRFCGDPLRLVANKGEMQLPIACFSEGEKSLLAMVGDLARRLAIANPERDDPLEGEGVVMIDEIDLHLHPIWQRKIASRLVKTFPNIQFIVTTHSPQVLGEIYSKNIILLEDTPEGIKNRRFSREVHGMTSDHVLEAMMETPERTEPVAAAIREAFEALERNDIEQAKEHLAWLSKNAEDIPELERIAMRIRRKETIGK